MHKFWLASERGSITLEGAIVVPLVVFVVGLSIYIVLLLFGQAQLQSASVYAAQRAAVAWRGGGAEIGGAYVGAVGGADYDGANVGDMGGVGGSGGSSNSGGASNSGSTNGNDGINSNDNTSRSGGFMGGGVFVNGGLYHRLYDSGAGEKIRFAADMADTRHDFISLTGYTQAQGGAAYQSGIFGKTLTVGLHGRTLLPNRNVMAEFGYGSVFSGSYAAKSLIPDFAENIRCIGYVIEIESKEHEATQGQAGAGDNFANIIGHIRSYIGGLLH
ncbi:MAG: hypothetical protein FWH01_01700 [Oscillospiraceae bacterium]|nr:hypothetical protein [Oscillospiraceae bacterium]